jgi:ribosomal protein S18 acetylase RimI-like enzyme
MLTMDLKMGRVFIMKEKLICANGLTNNQLLDIKKLSKTCNEQDKITMKLNWDFLNSRPKDEVQDFLFYEDTTLVGYLGLYIFNKREAEVSSMVHPEYRKQGVFTHLLQYAQEEVKKRHINELLFFSDRNSLSGIACLKNLETTYDFSEYLMNWKEQSTSESANDLLVRSYEETDLQTIISLDSTCFNIPFDEARKMVEVQLADSSNLHLIAELKGKIIGKINVLLKEDPAYIFGFCVHPSYQGQGYGQEILSKTLFKLVTLQRDNIVLEVAVKNSNALKLYEKVGFELVTGYDYYRLKI